MGTAGGFGAIVWWLSGRDPVPASGRAAFALRHVLYALLYAGGCVGVQWAFLRLSAGPDITRTVMRFAALWMALQSLLLYAIVAGLSYLLRTRRRLRAEQLAAARAEAAAAQAQLHALRAQLNPHFLFNALHSLGGLVRHDPEEAEQAVEELGTLLRYALDQSASDSVRLADEWDFCRTYLALEQRRLGERLRIDAALDDDALDCRVFPFVLQPLLENAVRHGLAPRPGGGTLTVRAVVRAGRLEIVVSDDGVGAAAGGAEGVGLSVLREQLRGRYADRARVVIATAPGDGYTVRMELPADASARRPRAVERAAVQPAARS
jgi:LytS/YehU family sensor histidine kinase